MVDTRSETWLTHCRAGSGHGRRPAMPWQEQSIVSLKQEFVTLADQEGTNMRALCRRFGISPQTGYKWLRRYRAEGPAGLAERSRRPRQSPRRTAAALDRKSVV